MTGLWIGVDPGSRWTGIVLRHGNRLLWHRVVERTDDEDVVRGVGVGPKYIDAVIAALGEALVALTMESPDSALDSVIGGHPNIAVEGVVRPTGFKDGKRVPLTDPSPAIGTGMVLGAILGAHGRLAVVIPPNHHGEAPLSTYPHELVTPAEMRHGLHRKAKHGSTVSHARAAWDLAGEGTRHAAIRSARRGATA